MNAKEVIERAKDATKYSAWATPWAMREAANMTPEEIDEVFGYAAANLHIALRSGKVARK
jgi:hypothetical protein